MARLVLDPSDRPFEGNTKPQLTWKKFYPDAHEKIPHNMPKPLGKRVCISSYVNTSFKNCKLSYRSRTGYVILLNNAPIRWLRKK